MANHLKLTGWCFGRLTVIAAAGSDKFHFSMWECKCDCGNLITVRGASLRNGDTKSCGCLHSEAVIRAHSKHGHAGHNAKSAVYQAYQDAKDRCTNPNNRGYKNYGGRGIKFLFSSFDEWLQELREKPHSALSVDRKNNDGHYEKGNVRWATKKEQQNNQRKRERRNGTP